MWNKLFVISVCVINIVKNFLNFDCLKFVLNVILKCIKSGLSKIISY